MTRRLPMLLRYISLLTCLGFILPSHSMAPPTPIKIAIIDTGVDKNHPYLKDHLWQNSGEKGLDKNGLSKSTNGIDDDGNGFVDDVYGWNFAQGNSSLSDKDGHGTHISGVIKNVITQYSPHIPFQLMSIKYFSEDSTSQHRTQAFIKSLKYAIDMEADIINISGGGPKFNTEELALLQRASSLGIVVVASAGNKRPDAENKMFYPAGYDLPNVLSVIATDKTGNVLRTSNVNETKTNIYAVGEKILSSLPNKKFGKKTGSSQATAILTGHIVKYLSEGKQFSIADLEAFSSMINNSTHSSLFVSNSAN